MNEIKRLYIVAGVFLAICILAGGISLVQSINSDKNFNTSSAGYVEKVDSLFSSEDKELIYIGRPTCYYCSLTTPILDNLSKKYNFNYNYINTDEISSTDLKKILAYFGIDIEDFGTPYIAIVQNGEIVKSQDGYSEEESMFNFLKESEIIDSEAIYEVTVEEHINELTYDDYDNLINDNNNQLVVIVQTGCGYCTKQEEVLKKIYEEYGYKFNILNIKELSTEEKSLFTSSLSYYNDNEWGTPLSLVVKNKEVVDNLPGYRDYDEYVKFLKDNGFIGD